jgi:CRP/FNR family transcriptional regulator, cyclic AMP receptor protein
MPDRTLYRVILRAMGLADVPLLATLDRPRLDRLAEAAPARTVAAGTVLAVRGEAATRLLIVETGGVLATRHTRPAAGCASASSPHRVPSTSPPRSPAARRHVLAHRARRVRDQQDDLVLASLADAATRTAAWLVRAAAVGGSRVVVPGAQRGLAEAIGMTRVSVNRALRTLAADGLVRVEPGAVVLLAPELLALRANPDAATGPAVPS